MEDISNQIKANIDSILLQYYSEGISKVSADKIIKYIKNKYNFDVDMDYLTDMLSDNPNVDSINDDQIVLGTPKQEEEDEVDEELHDNAVEQAQDNLEQFESVADALDRIKLGTKFNAKRIRLEESDLCYHLHNGAVKAKSNYIITSILPKKNLNESLVRCKIDNSSLYIEIPVKYFVKTLDKTSNT